MGLAVEGADRSVMVGTELELKSTRELGSALLGGCMCLHSEDMFLR